MVLDSARSNIWSCWSVTFSWQAHCLVMLERQFLWQVQHLAGYWSSSTGVVPGAIFGHVGVSLFPWQAHCLVMLERQFLWQVQHLAG